MLVFKIYKSSFNKCISRYNYNNRFNNLKPVTQNLPAIANDNQNQQADVPTYVHTYVGTVGR